MSWLKHSASASSVPSANTSFTSASITMSSKNAQSSPHITRFLACGTVYITHTISVPASLVQPAATTAAYHDIDDDAGGGNIDSTTQAIKAPTQMPATTNVRAKQITTQRGGSAVNVLSLLAQFSPNVLLSTSSSRPSPSSYNNTSNNNSSTRRTYSGNAADAVECALVSPLGSDAAGRALMHELEFEGIRTRFCKIHPAGVPVAFVLRSDESQSRTVINHNPLPELSHEDFIALLGPILVPEHYLGIQTYHWHPHPTIPHLPPVHPLYGPGPGLPPLITTPTNHHTSSSHGTQPGSSSPNNATGPNAANAQTQPQQPLPPNTPGLPSNPPFTIFHVVGRSPGADGITLANLTGVDGLARDRFWRDKATFSLDCTAPVVNGIQGKPAREQLFPHVDVIFYSKAYALSVNPSTPASKLTPRSFLLSQVPLVAPHALLLVHWDHEGGALLSVPTREYLQSSVWTDPALDVGSKTPITPADPVSAPPHQQQHQNLLHHYASAAGILHPGNSSGNADLRPELRPETQLSLGSEDPRYREFSTISSNPHGDGARSPRKPLPDWVQEHLAHEGGGRHRGETPTDEGPLSPSSPTNNGNVIDHLEAQISTGIVGVGGSGIGGASFDYGFTADAFANVTPDSSWDYRANRTAVIYDSGDDSETDMERGAGGSGTGHQGPVRLGLQTEMVRMGTGPSGVIISEGVALSPSDVDSDIDVTVATGASRFVMQERIRRVYGPLEGDPVDSDALDNSSLEQSEDGNDSDATEDGRNKPFDGPTRIGKLKKERMRLREEQELERLRREEEEQERALASLDAEGEGDGDDRKSMRSVRSDLRLPPPKRLPPIPICVIEAWQAGLLYALTRHVLPGAPYCPNVPSPKVTDTKGNNNNNKTGKKPDAQDSDWAWKWRLDECLRFAAEMAGRRARKGTMEGLAREMAESGWL
ncbi:hypothetical protein CPB86DRAFT_781748 [Serendipita vermifera]|nr:hypothetical protein CPB86DRAFT_781748 [Serendipita vermifera]